MSTRPKCVYQFRISLVGITPEIWRRFQVVNCTLDEFHEYIQLAMGWENCHLYVFEVGDERICNPRHLEPMLDGEFEFTPSISTKLSDILPSRTTALTFHYTYNIEDDWLHEIEFEGRVPFDEALEYPRCLAGERACPPEDIAGFIEYERFAKAIFDPGHDDHDMYLEWVGKFDPEKFSGTAATKAMRKGFTRKSAR